MTSEGTALCRSVNCRPSDRGGPREVEPGRSLCRVCASRIQPDLASMAGMFGDLRARLGIEGKAGEKITGTKIPGIVINEPVSDLIREVTEWVRGVARELRKDNPRTQPPQNFDAETLLAWLATYHGWRLTYRCAPEYTVTVAEWSSWYRSEMRRVAYPSGARRFDIPGGSCRAPVIVGSVEVQAVGLCGGQLYAIIRDESPLLPSEIVCEANGEHRIPSGQWVQYARQLEKAMREAE